MMKRAIFLLVMLCCYANAYGTKLKLDGKLSFFQPFYDTTTLPNASTTVLMHFEDNYNDLGGGTWTNGTNAWSGFASATYKFGEYSAYHKTAFNTTVHYFQSLTATAAVSVGSGDFTLEFYAGIDVNSNSIGGNQDAILSVDFITGAADALFQVENAYSPVTPAQYVPGLKFLDTGGTNFGGYYSGHGYFSGLNWFHCCFERRSGTLYGYINGEQVMTGAMAYTPAGITRVSVDAYNRNYLDATFYIDELRVYKGGYVYGGVFTPPTLPFGLARNNRLNIRRSMP